MDDLRKRNKIPARVLVTLRAVLGLYVRKRKLADPLADLPAHALEQEKVKLIEVLISDPERLRDVIKHGYGYGNPSMGLLNELSLFTGLRPRELIKLRWDDMNLDKQEWFINLSGKGKSPRAKRIHLPMSAHVAHLLVQHKQLRRDGHPFVFPHHERAKQEHMDVGGYKKMVAHIRTKCGKGFNGDNVEDNWTLYQNRKAFDSIGAVRARIDDAIACTLTGRSIGGSRAHYMFATPDALRPSIESITEILLGYTTARKAKAA